MGASELVPSYGSWPAMWFKRIAASSTVLVIGPGESVDEAIATTPYRLTLPYVGLRPTVPHHAAGWRMEPAVSEPIAAIDMSAATAAALPPEDPPGKCSVLRGLSVR